MRATNNFIPFIVTILPVKVTVNFKTLKLLKVAFVLCYKNQIFPYFNAKCLCSLSLQEGLPQTASKAHNFLKTKKAYFTFEVPAMLGIICFLCCSCKTWRKTFIDQNQMFVPSRTLQSCRSASLLPLLHCFKSTESRGFFPPLSEVLIYIISFVTHDLRKISHAILIKITVNYLTLHLLKCSFWEFQMFSKFEIFLVKYFHFQHI